MIINGDRFRDGKQMTPGGRIKTESEDGIYKLVFSEVWESDGGEYMCQVENPLGSDKCFADLKVAGAFLSFFLRCVLPFTCQCYI